MSPSDKSEQPPDGNSLINKFGFANLAINALGPIRDRANDLMSDPTELDKLLVSGAEKARAVAEETLALVYDRIGFIRAS